MKTPDEYLRRAEEAETYAKALSLIAHRQPFLDIAWEWRRLAQEVAGAAEAAPPPP